MMNANKQMKTLMRGVVYPENELGNCMTRELYERLEKKGNLRVYLGVDPTTPGLHLGHTVAIQKLKHFQDLGHTVIFLIGDFTGMIGDPTGTSKTRPHRSSEEVLECAKTYTEQAFKILDRKKTEIMYNSEWLSSMTFEKVIKFASKLSLARILSHEDFRQRYEKGISVRLHEMLYCLMQGYDAFILDVDVQVGGTDQLFNMLVGRSFQEDTGKLPHIPVTLPLLIGTDGKRKMSQSYGNDISLADTPKNMFGKIMSIPDFLISPYFELLTDIPIEELKDIILCMEKDSLNPINVKMRLAKEIVTRFHGKEIAAKEDEYFDQIIRKKQMPEEIPEVQISGNNEGDELPLVDLLFIVEMVSAKGEARRLIKQGGVYLNSKRIADQEHIVNLTNGLVIRVGKRKFCRLKF